jgi:hypothetical protein
LEDHAASHDAGYDGDVHTLHRMGAKPARFINATGGLNLSCHGGHEWRVCHMAGIGEMMQFIAPIANLAGSWLQGKADKNAAEAKLKLTEAEAKAKIMLSEKTSVADWERIMAEGSQNSFKDEWLVALFSVPLVLSFCGEWGRKSVQEGFTALEAMPDWYQYTLGVIVAASFGVRSATKFFRGSK